MRVGDRVNFRVRSSLMDLRVAAVACLGSLAEHGGPAFVRFLPEAHRALMGQVQHFHDEVREAAICSLIRVAFAVNDATPPVPGGPGEPLIMRSPAREVYAEILTQLLEVLRVEHHLTAVAQACVGVQQFVKRWGVGAVQHHHEALMSALLVILHERAACQLAADDDDESGGDADATAGGTGNRRSRLMAAAAESAASGSALATPRRMP